MGSEAFWIAEEPMNHAMDFFHMRGTVEWHKLLSEAFVVYYSVSPKLFAIRKHPSEVDDS